MKSVLHLSHSRGHANHGWLESYHSFSFANYHDANRIHFGALRVLNDDTVHGGKGFGTHPHKDMEIISIPLEGDLEHKDSMGNITIIREGDVQVMSAGTGVMHSEYNKNAGQPVKFLQIWVFPNQKGVEPRYDQISIRDIERSNQFYQILSPNSEDQGVWIHQNAWFSLGKFDSGKRAKYSVHNQKNGVYFFILEGEAKINGQELGRRDGYGVWETSEIEMTSLSDCKVLLMEVPMELN